ncbi:polyprenyl synthetase family protein [Halorutilales archaeon Cl-col2-1]
MSKSTVDVRSEIQKRAETVNESFDEYLPEDEPKSLYEASLYLLRAGGKRLRPALLLLTAEALGEDNPEKTVPAAVSIETIHSFTLIHDDIMDDDDLRRGVPSVHVEWDEPTAILAGDTLYSKAFEVMLKADVDPEDLNYMMKVLAESCTGVCEGQALDIEFERSDEVGEDEYMEMVEKKTAVLFGAAAGIGAVVADADDETVEAMYDAGIKMGKAFQIQDDVLDITGSTDEIGKTHASDLVEDKQTLINIHARRNGVDTSLDDDATREEIRDKIDEIEGAGSIEYARQRADELIDDAKESLEGLPESEAKDILLRLSDFVVEREH